MYFLRNSAGLVQLSLTNIDSYVHFGSLNMGESGEMDSLLRSMHGVFVPLLTL